MSEIYQALLHNEIYCYTANIPIHIRFTCIYEGKRMRKIVNSIKIMNWYQEHDFNCECSKEDLHFCS